MSTTLRRGACPGLSAPMQTGDGLLARLMPLGDMSTRAFIGFCKAARRHGNGTIEVTARGSLQVRGLSPETAPQFAGAVAALDIPASDGVPVTADPLGAVDPDAVIDSAALAAQLREAIATVSLPLGPKVSVTLDSGAHLHLDALPADIRLRAIGTVSGPRLAVAIGAAAASATPLGTLSPEAAIAATVRLLGVIAAQGRDARARNVLRRDGVDAFRDVIGGEIDPVPALLPPPRSPAEPVGRHPLRDGTIALGIALAFGHAQAEALARLAEIAAAHGIRAIRPAPGRALLLIGAETQAVADLATEAAQLGFVVRADDPRRRIIACPGRPACAAGLIEARALAADIAATLPPGSALVHVSGCAKGCAHPASAALTVVGTERGCGIVRHGSAQAVPRRHVAPDELAAEIARIADEADELVHG
jgi:precorrin-3B synthase